MALAAATLAAAGCLDGFSRRLDRPRGAALWASAAAGSLGPAELGRLGRSGFGELFLSFAEVRWTGAEPELFVLGEPALPRGTAVTLVVEGPWPGHLDDSEAAGKALAAELHRITIEAEGRGLQPLGFHLDLAVDVRDLESWGSGLEGVRAELESGLFLSAGVERSWLAAGELEAVLDAVDFFAVFLYGQRPGEPLKDEDWTFKAVREDLGRLENLGRDYLVGVVTAGTVVRSRSEDKLLGWTHGGSLTALAFHPGFELAPGFSLRLLDSRRYTFRARGATRLGGWEVSAGDLVDVVGPAVTHLRELEAVLREEERDHYLGALYYRLPVAGEALSLTLDDLLLARSATPLPAQELHAEVSLVDRRRDRMDLAVTLTNPGPDPTDLASIDVNYLELIVEGGFFERVDLGGFSRYQLLRRAAAGARLSFRDATVLRLYRPVLEEGQAVTSGRLRLRLTGSEPVVHLRVDYLMPDGDSPALPVSEWRPE